MQKGVALLFFLFGSLAFAQNIVTITNAQKAAYGKDPVSGGDTIILTGAVEISVENDGSKTIISADSVTVNREKDLLYAEGGITLTRTGNGENENMTAETLLINTKTFEGIFDGARIVSLGSTGKTADLSTSSASSTANSLSSAPSTLIVSADLFGRDVKGTMVFKSGTLTFCDDENPHWRIKASRIWLLPGGEFALLNARLYVGNIPVFYLPFFYYPKDELVINPVIGYEPRRGYYFQTTTYLIGRKPLEKDEGDSQFNFMKLTELKEQKLEGIVLRNLDEDLVAMPKHSLKFIGDYYSNLGFLVGLEGVFAPGLAVTGIDFAVYTGFSKTIRQVGSAIYSPFFPSGNEYRDESNLFGLTVPFRYMIDFNIRVAKPFSLTASIPFYSDTTFKTDFREREETMDWLSYITSNNTDASTTTASGETTSFTWTLASSYSIPVSLVTPYISLALLKYNFDFTFAAGTNTALTDGVPSADMSALLQNSPMKKFFYPSQMTPAKVTADISGTLYAYPEPQKTTRTAGVSSPVPALKPPEMLAPLAESELPKNTESEPSDAESGIPKNAEENIESEKTDTVPGLPVFNFATTATQNVGGVVYRLSYTAAPDLVAQSQFGTPTKPSEIRWDETISSVLIFKSPLNLQSSLSWRDGFIGMNNTFKFAPAYQTHTHLREDITGTNGYTPVQIDTMRRNDYDAQKLDLSLNTSVSFKPFVYNPYFSGTGVSWNTDFLLLRTKFIGSSGNPEWDYLPPDWNEESFATHSLNFTFAAKEDAFSQSLTLSSTLPPRVDRYSLALTLGFPYLTVTAGSGIGQVSSVDDTWKWDPLRQSAQISLFSGKLFISESYSYGIEEKEHLLFQTGISGYGVKFDYTMQYTYGYDFKETTPGANDWAWKSRDKQEFLPVSLSLSYTHSGKEIFAWKNRFKLLLGLSTELNYNMIRPTSSYFTFSPKITFEIFQFLHISFYTTSRNNSLFRYFQDAAGFPVEIPGEKNLFLDLLHSFAFWDDNLRKSSAFKLQTLNLEVTHDLHDWTLASKLTISPRATSDVTKNPYETTFSLSVLWRPMQSIKASIQDKDGEFILNPSDEK